MFQKRGRGTAPVATPAAAGAPPPPEPPPPEPPSPEPPDPDDAEPGAAQRFAALIAGRAIPPSGDGTPLANALSQAGELWAAPGPGELALGAAALLGGRAAPPLAGVQLWPALTESAHAPALLLTDFGRRARVVVDITPPSGGRDPRPGWLAAADLAHQPRLPGSHALWRHWQPELLDRAPHEWSSACEGHTHLARGDVRGNLMTAVPRHDAWVMSRAWLPADVTLPSADDVRWVVLALDDRPLRAREPQIRSTWELTCYADFAAAVEAATGAPLPAGPAAVLARLASAAAA